jgi:hypothetical protein
MLLEARACGLKIDRDAEDEALDCPEGEPDDRIAPTHDSMTLAWKFAEWVPRLVWDKTDGKGHLHWVLCLPTGSRAHARCRRALSSTVPSKIECKMIERVSRQLWEPLHALSTMFDGGVVLRRVE